MGPQREPKPGAFLGTLVKDASFVEGLARCVHCGLCVPHCPTFRILRVEPDSPRGRLHIMRALTWGRIGPAPMALKHLDLCLLCRHCEAVCPSGVPFGHLMETVRAELRSSGPLWWAVRRLAARVLLRPLPMLSAHWLLRAVGNLPMPISLLRRAAPGAALLMSLAQAPRRAPYLRRGLLARPKGERKGRVALLLGCVVPYLTPQTHVATVALLARAGLEVVAPEGQACCGALYAHIGDLTTARRLARRNIDAFLGSHAEAIVVNAAGCGAMLKEYPHLLAHDRRYRPLAERFASLVRDVTELLAQMPLPPPPQALPMDVTYQDPCHLAHAQGIREAPRRLLRMIPGIRLVEMEAPDECCGSAGVYNLLHPHVASTLARRRMAQVVATGAQVVATANVGCALQLQAAARLYGRRLRVAHVVELLHQAYRATPNEDSSLTNA